MTSVLEVRAVAKRFGDLQAVEALSFEVRAGEIFGFLGPNGAGKTTTLRMLMGITAPDSGEVIHEGRPGIDRRRVGYLPEERGLFEDAPVLEVLRYLGELRGMRAAEARAAGRELLRRFELDDRAKQKVNTLSKGNQQKVQLIGAVLHRPALAVLDEPFSGLDPLNQEVFLEFMRELRDAGTAVLLSAHHLDLVERLADRFLLIARGRDVLSGTLEELRRAATGGNDERLRLELSAREGERLDAGRLAAAALAAAPGAQVVHEPNGESGLRLDVWLPRGADLGPLLTALARIAVLSRAESHRLRLHEIYLRAVRKAGGEVSESEVVGHA